MRNPELLLQSGALLPVGTVVQTSNSLSAQTFRHPALAVPVVRLVADGLAPGADAEMAALGFGPAEATPPLGGCRSGLSNIGQHGAAASDGA